jgi:3',5'-cyclic AMP phosphodiesterase CpdA
MAGTGPAMTCFTLSMSFTLAHLSDPHLSPLPAPRPNELIGKRVTGYINWQRRRRYIHDAGVLDRIVADLKAQMADHVACTGDLANIALPEEFTHGAEWLESLSTPENVSLVPGNHDAYVRGALADASHAWAPYMFGDHAAGFPYLRRRGPLALIGLSSAVSTGWGMASGRLGGAQIRALGKMLEALKREGLFRVLLIHHPPASAAKWHKLLRDAGPLKHAIAAHGAELLLHGHDHLAMLNWLKGPGGTRVPAVGVPSASAAPGQAKNAAAYNLYAIEGEPGAWACEMVSRGIDASGEVGEQKKMMLTV